MQNALKIAGLSLIICLVAGNSNGQSLDNGSRRTTGRAVSEYWTAERMRNAVPMDRAIVTTPQKSVAPSTGTVARSSAFVPLIEPKAQSSEAVDLPKLPIIPQQRSDGAYANPYTTGIVFPDSQVNQWPYRLSGKMFFTDAGLNYTCSASVISRRLIITAAHCIYNTAANRWHSNLVFAPAYNANLSLQPFGLWNWTSARVPNGWINGCQCFPSNYDFGSFTVADKLIGSTVYRVGDYLGWFGWTTYRLVGNNVTQLGYPGNLDGARRMIQNNSQVGGDGSYAGRIGTAMQKGSSGGPWVQDFGWAAPGQVISSSGSNSVVGVTSYGTPGYQYAGATILNTAWSSLFNAACAEQAGNC